MYRSEKGCNEEARRHRASVWLRNHLRLSEEQVLKVCIKHCVCMCVKERDGKRDQEG